MIKNNLICAFVILFQILNLVNGFEHLPWPIFCKTISGEFCSVELEDRKLFCPSMCKDENHDRDTEKHLIVDLKQSDHNNLQRMRRQTSTLNVFTAALMSEFTRMFIEASTR